MGLATMTTVNAILKEVYEGRLEDQLQSELTAIKRLERTSEGVVETVGGKYVDFPIRVQRNTGIGNRLENEQLPVAGQQGYAVVHIPLQYGYARCRITGQVMELADKNYQAFASGMDLEMENLKTDVLKDTQRQIYGDSSGLMASVTAGGVGVAVVTVDNVQYLEIGFNVDILTRSSGGTVTGGSNLTISNINEITKVVTLQQSNGSAAAITAGATEGLYRQGNYAAGTKREISGFAQIVNATTVLHGVDPAVQPKWQAAVVANGGSNRALSEGLMIQTCDGVRIKGGKTSAIFTNLGVRRAYFNLLTQQRRYTDTKEFAGGFKGLAFNYGSEIPVVEDVDASPNAMWFMDESHMKIYRSKEWHWADTDGSVLKWVHDYDAWEGVLRQYWEVGTNQRNAHAKLADVTEG